VVKRRGGQWHPELRENIQRVFGEEGARFEVVEHEPRLQAHIDHTQAVDELADPHGRP
jgi:hypothetical protein